MRIISSFHDFYDIGLAYGQDNTVLFRRETSLVKDLAPWSVEMPWDALSSAARSYDGGPLGPDTRLLGRPAKRADPWGRWDPEGGAYLVEGFLLLGGTAHAIWLDADATLKHYGPGPTYLDGTPIVNGPAVIPLGFPDQVTAEQWWTRHLRAQVVGQVAALGADQPIKVVDREFNKKSAVRDANTYADLRTKVLAHDWADLHLTHGSPVLLIVPPTRGRYWYAYKEEDYKATLVVNPRLADFQLQHSPAFDPYGVFQNVVQFIGGVMPGGQAPLVQLTDRDQVRKKGFDPVYGFRTRPSVRR